MATLSLATVGGKITATLINQIVNVLSPRTVFTPTIAGWSSATVAPTTSGSYVRSGNQVTMTVQTKLGTGTITVGPSITVTVPPSLPIDTTGLILESFVVQARVGFNDVSAATEYAGDARIMDANTIRILRNSSGTGALGNVSSTNPFTFATLDEMSIVVTYITSA